jgi:hypothetical protein
MKFMARMVNAKEILDARPGGAVEPGWDMVSYPWPSDRFKDDRPKAVATERMLWREDYRLCAAIGHEYAIEDEPLLMTQSEFDALHAPRQTKKSR